MSFATASGPATALMAVTKAISTRGPMVMPISLSSAFACLQKRHIMLTASTNDGQHQHTRTHRHACQLVQNICMSSQKLRRSQKLCSHACHKNCASRACHTGRACHTRRACHKSCASHACQKNCTSRARHTGCACHKRWESHACHKNCASRACHTGCACHKSCASQTCHKNCASRACHTGCACHKRWASQACQKIAQVTKVVQSRMPKKLRKSCLPHRTCMPQKLCNHACLKNCASRACHTGRACHKSCASQTCHKNCASHKSCAITHA